MLRAQPLRQAADNLVVAPALLGRLDDRELLLERRKWVGLREQLRKEYRDALATLDRARVNIISARISQAEAQLDLIEGNLQRTRLVAPFAGVVVRGDLPRASSELLVGHQPRVQQQPVQRREPALVVMVFRVRRCRLPP